MIVQYIIHLLTTTVAAEIPVRLIINPPGPVYPAEITITLECTVDLPPPTSNITTVWRVFCVNDDSSFTDSYFLNQIIQILSTSTSDCQTAAQCVAFDAVGNSEESETVYVTTGTGK